MARTNVLVCIKHRICTVQPAEEGLSDSLFSNGVRIYQHCLNLTEALGIIRSTLNHDILSLEDFKQAVNEEDDGARSTQYVGFKSKYGETTDKGITSEMLTQRKNWI